MPKLFSSDDLIKALRKNGFSLVSQKGSHVKLQKDGYTVIVPSPRKEIPTGTYRSIVRQSGLDRSIFEKK